MIRFVKRIDNLNTTFDYTRGIKLNAISEVHYIKNNKKNPSTRKSMGRSLVLRRSTNRHK